MEKTYSEKLRDPRWQKIRLRVFERDEFSCQHCGDGSVTLNVHHRYYISGREPWEYPLWSMTTLCEQCHKDEKDNAGELSDWEKSADFMEIGSLIGQRLAYTIWQFQDDDQSRRSFLYWLEEAIRKERMYICSMPSTEQKQGDGDVAACENTRG